MTSFFGELGKRLAEKWISLLLLPSLLLAAVAVVAVAVGHRTALDPGRLAVVAGDWAAWFGGLPATSQLLLFGVMLLACSAAGLAVRASTGLTQRAWLGDWGPVARPVAARLVHRREGRWAAANAEAVAAEEAGDTAARDRAAARRNAIALARPSRPTWMGDQLAATDARVHNQYGADLAAWWPRLWLVVDESTRSELRAARSVFDTAAMQAGWAPGYLVLAVIWWPSALIATGVWVVAWLRGRAAIRTYAQLVEAAVDVHKADLARRLDLLGDDKGFDMSTGIRVTAVLRKGT
jgi:hypothetical protein